MSRTSASKRCWFFHNDDGKLLGPFNEIELVDFMTEGFLLRSTKVWDGEQATKWTPLGKVPGLLQRLRRKQRGFSELEIKLESVFSDKSESMKKSHTRSSSSLTLTLHSDKTSRSNHKKKKRSSHKRDSLVPDRVFSPDVSEEEKCGVSRPIPICRSVSPSASATTFTLTDDRVSGSDVASPLPDPSVASERKGHGRWMSTAGMSVSGRWDLGSEAGLLSPNSCCSGSFFSGGVGLGGGSSGLGSASAGAARGSVSGTGGLGPSLEGLAVSHRRSDWFVDPIHDVIIDDERCSDALSPRSNRVSSQGSSECGSEASTTDIDDDYYLDSCPQSRSHSRRSSAVRMVGDIFRQLGTLTPLTSIEKGEKIAKKVDDLTLDVSATGLIVTPSPVSFSMSRESSVVVNKDLLVIHQNSHEPSLVSSEDGLDIDDGLTPEVSMDLGFVEKDPPHPH